MTQQEKKIGVVTATIVGMNAMIGAGIFSVPAALASYVGPAGLITYAFVVIAVWFMGLTMARLAQLYPQEGSFYVYASQWGGHVLGLLSAGSYFVGLIIAMGLLVQIAGGYLHVWFPSWSSNILSIITLLLLVMLNIIGVSISQVGQYILICCTVFPIIATIILCLFNAKLSYLTPFMPYGFENVFAATKAVIFGFFGFECAASLFSIVENPEKNVPRAFMYSITLVGLLYIIFVGSIILSVPLALFSDTSIPLPEVLAQIFPNHPFLINFIHFSILSAVIGTVHSMIWSSSALFLSYLKQFKSQAIKKIVSSKYTNHSATVLVVGVCIFISFATLKSINLFFSLTSIFLIFSFITSMITLLTLKSEWKSKQNIYTIIGLFTAGIIFYFALEGLIVELMKL